MSNLMFEQLEGRELMSGDVVTNFTPPIGSNKGSRIGSLQWATAPSGIAMDGMGPVLSSLSRNEVAVDSALADAAVTDFDQHKPQPKGIIAILIG